MLNMVDCAGIGNFESPYWPSVSSCVSWYISISLGAIMVFDLFLMKVDRIESYMLEHGVKPLFGYWA